MASAAIRALANFVTLPGLLRRGADALAGIDASLGPYDIVGREGTQPRHERKNFAPKKSKRGPPRNFPPLAKRKARLGAEQRKQGQEEAEPGRIRDERRRERAREGRWKRARQRLQGEGEAFVFSSDHAPAELPLVDLSEPSRAGFLSDRPVRKDGLEAVPRERPRQRGIVGKRIAHGGDAAGAREIAAPVKHCLADAKAKA